MFQIHANEEKSILYLKCEENTAQPLHTSKGIDWDDIKPEYCRWLYTALTRAKKQVYLINFKEEYFME